MCRAMRFSTLLCCLFASACANGLCEPVIKTEIIERAYPASLFDCAAPPVLSEGPYDADVLRDLARVTAAYEDCKRAIETARLRVPVTGE